MSEMSASEACSNVDEELYQSMQSFESYSLFGDEPFSSPCTAIL